MPRYPYRQIGVSLNRDFRNNQNQNLLDIAADIAEQKTRIDTQISSVEQPNEVVDARVDTSGTAHTVLKDRLDSDYNNTAAQLADMETQTNHQADKDYLENMINTAFSGMGQPYATLSDLQTAFPNGDSKPHVVAADGNWYFWSTVASAWTSGGQFQAVQNADGSITPLKIAIMKQSANLFNKNTITSGYYVKYTDGTLVPLTGYSASDYIPVKPNTQYIKNTTTQFAFYDANKNYISGLNNGHANPFTTPLNASYIRISISDPAQIEAYMVAEGTALPSNYVPYYFYFDTSNPIYPYKLNDIGTENILDGSVTKAKLEADINSKLLEFLQLANTYYMLNGIDRTSVTQPDATTIDYLTNTTFGSVGFSVSNSNGNKYVAVTTITNIGSVAASGVKRLITYNNSPSSTSEVDLNGSAVSNPVTMNIGSSSQFVDVFTSDNGSYSAIALNVFTSTSGANLEIKQKIYDVTLLSDDIVNTIDWANLAKYTAVAEVAKKAITSVTADSASSSDSLNPTYESALVNSVVDYSEDAINCWGDSLTHGVGTSSNDKRYPMQLAALSGKTVYEMGIGGETAALIAARQGAWPIFVNNIIIPADTTPVQIGDANTSGFVDGLGSNLKMIRQGGGTDASVNPCTIAGVQGSLTWTGSTYDDPSGTYTFTRLASGDAVAINRPAQLITYAMTQASGRRDNISVFWAGTNDKPDGITVQSVVSKIKVMKDFSRSKKYIVIGLTSKSYMPDIVNVNVALLNEFGYRFLDIRQYLIKYGLSDAGIAPTSQDNTDISNGEIPTSLRSDDVHLNDSGYLIVAQQVYKKLQNLGYLS